MEDKIDQILDLSENTYREVSQKEGWFSKFLNIFEKLIIPIMLGILAYVASSASNKIAQSQLDLSNAQLSMAQAEAARNDDKHRADLRAKYIELLIEYINSGDASKQKFALSVLNTVDNSLAQEMATIIETNKSVPESVEQKIKKIRQTARNTAVAHATGRSGNWRRYEVCVTVPTGAVMDKSTAKSKVIGGVGAGSWGNWEGDFRFIGSDKVCRTFAHQIHDQDRLLEISVEYEIEKKTNK